MSYRIEATKKYMKDVAKAKARGLDVEELLGVVGMLAEGKELPPELKDHPLKGNYKGCRECHVHSDWLLIYSKDKQIKLVTLVRTGTHSDLF